MKRLFILLIALIPVLSLLALPIAADEASDADAPKQTTSVSNENNNNGNKNEDKNATLTDIFNSISDIAKYFKEPARILELIEIDISSFKDGTILGTLKNGGYNYFSGKDNPINATIATLYNITYPIGIVIMIIVWIIGLLKGTTTMALDLKDKNSLARSMIGFLIGLAAMTVAPYILTALTAISNWLCLTISSASINSFFDIFKNDGFFKMTGGSTLNLYRFINNYFINGETAKDFAQGLEIEVGSPQYLSLGFHIIYGIIVVIVIEFVFCLNMLWLALLQVVSPIFIGLCASGIARKLTFNFIKEYFKALLMPIVSLIYTALCMAMLGTDAISNLVLIGLGTTIGGVAVGVAGGAAGSAVGGAAGGAVGGAAAAGGSAVGGVVGGVVGGAGGVGIAVIGIIVILFAAIFPLVFSISTLGIAGKKLDKLIN